MTNPYSTKQLELLGHLREHYRSVINGTCMAAIGYGDESPRDPCEGPIGNRHAIARRHLKLIGGCDGMVRANKEIGTFDMWPEQYEDLKLVSIRQFSAGKWSCQNHDERFGAIDAKEIDLSEPESLFKAIYRVVVRHNHLVMARWSAFCEVVQSEESLKVFKETAFKRPVSDLEFTKFEDEWRNVAHAVMEKMLDLETRLQLQQWHSLDFRSLLVASKPMVAGWGCLTMKFDVRSLHANDPRRHYESHVELGYMVVIPQEEGHAIVTACEPDTRFRVQEIVQIHRFMPIQEKPNEPYTANENVKHMLSRRFWRLNEIAIRESLYQSWSKAEQRHVQAWRKSGEYQNPRSLNHPSCKLPCFF